MQVREEDKKEWDGKKRQKGHLHFCFDSVFYYILQVSSKFCIQTQFCHSHPAHTPAPNINGPLGRTDIISEDILDHYMTF